MKRELHKFEILVIVIALFLFAMIIHSLMFPAPPAKNYTFKVKHKWKKMSGNEMRYFVLLEDSLKNVIDYYGITAEEYYQGNTLSVKKIVLKEYEYKILIGQ